VKVFVFLGPTLSHELAQKELDAIYLPPVAQGDVYRAAKERPFAIGIIDGYFERLPAVWHKEILWALSQPIHVFGAASMGALRATELARYGMQGIGAIYRGFATGKLQDDDEVAVTHGEADTGFRAMSEAMVNIRATLARAVAEGVITAGLRRRLERIAKATFYAERSYPDLLARAHKAGVAEGLLAPLRKFVSTNRVDQKRADALLMLRAVRECCAVGAMPPPPGFAFQHTEAWDQAAVWAEAQPAGALRTDTAAAEQLAAEVRLLGEQGRGLLAGAYARLAAGLLTQRRPVPQLRDRLDRLDQHFREGVSITDLAVGQERDRFSEWLASQGLSTAGYHDFLERQARFDWLREHYRTEVHRYLLDELRRVGEYTRIERRASDKQRVLERHGLQEPALEDAGTTRTELLDWYFEHRLGRRRPPDLETALADCGLASARDLEREALRELLYTRLQPPPTPENPSHGNDSGSRQRSDAPA
jgi:hypothetical protein